MQLAVFDDDRLAVVDGEVLIDITDALDLGHAGPGGPLRAFLDAGGGPAELAALDLGNLPRHDLATARLAPPVLPRAVIAAPVNYRDHQQEMHEQRSIADYGVFLKAADSVIGPGEQIQLPYTDKRTDQEGELGVVIGRRASRVAPRDALDHVLGYLPVLDISLRSTEDRSTRKSFRTFTPLGPWITTADAVPDPGGLELRCWVGGRLRQHASTADLIVDVPHLISYASHIMDLHPGDVIATGTPAGVGPLRDGDDVALEIEGLGRLEVRVSDDGAVRYADRPGLRGLGLAGSA